MMEGHVMYAMNCTQQEKNFGYGLDWLPCHVLQAHGGNHATTSHPRLQVEFVNSCVES